MEAGIPFRVKVNMDISVAVKGKFVNGHIYGDLQYSTKDEDDCSKAVEHKHIVQMSFKAYAHKGIHNILYRMCYVPFYSYRFQSRDFLLEIPISRWWSGKIKLDLICIK